MHCVLAYVKPTLVWVTQIFSLFSTWRKPSSAVAVSDLSATTSMQHFRWGQNSFCTSYYHVGRD